MKIIPMVRHDAEDVEKSEKAVTLPMLEATGVKAVLWCQWIQGIEVGDHEVVFAEVHYVGGEGREEEGNGGLCYAGGKYRRVGGIIEIGQDGSEEEIGDERQGDDEKEGRREVMRRSA